MKTLLFALAALITTSGAAAQEADCARERTAMVDIVRAHARSDPKALPSGMSDKVLEVMGRTLRHRFIPDGTCAIGYLDRPLPIGHRSTISQPYIVALMTELAAVPADGVALEIGTGSGYQAAILAQLTRKVCTVEIVQPLAVTSTLVLRELGYSNVDVRLGDGYQGWPECGPYRRHHRHRRARRNPAAVARAAQGRRQARHAGRIARLGAASYGGRQGRAGQDDDARRHCGALRTVKATELIKGVDGAAPRPLLGFRQNLGGRVAMLTRRTLLGRVAAGRHRRAGVRARC